MDDDMNNRSLAAKIKKNLAMGLVVVLGVLAVGTARILNSTKRVVPQTTFAAGTSYNCTTGVDVTVPSPTLVPSPTVVPCVGKFDAVLVIDRSGSMGQIESDGRIKLEWAKDAARAFVEAMSANLQAGIRLAQAQGLPAPQVRVGLVSFGDYNEGGVRKFVKLDRELTADLAGLLPAINGWQIMDQVGASSCLECGLRVARQELDRYANDSNILRTAVMLSDGEANRVWDGSAPGGEISKTAAVAEANTGRNSGLLVNYYAVGFSRADGTGINPGTLKGIAGDRSNYQYKPNVAQWAATFRGLADSICLEGSSRTAVFTPTADTYADKAYPTSNYGMSSTLKISGSSSSLDRISFMRFNIGALQGKKVTGVKLKFVISDPSGTSQNVKLVANNNWAEVTGQSNPVITWNNYASSFPLSTLLSNFSTGGATGEWSTDINSTAAVGEMQGRADSSSPITLGLDSTGSFRDTLAVRSKEMRGDQPALVVTYEGSAGTAPTAASCSFGPYNIPGKVEAENYMCGGEGTAYHDLDSANRGNTYRRTEGVDVQTSGDTGGGYNVGWTRNGEWLKYKVNVTETGTYNLVFRVASTGTSGRFRLKVDGVDVMGQKSVPNTGGWQTYTNVTVNGVSLTAGGHTLELWIEGDSANYNYIQFTSAGGGGGASTPRSSWNFDDETTRQGFGVISGTWGVIADASAPSTPNVYRVAGDAATATSHPEYITTVLSPFNSNMAVEATVKIVTDRTNERAFVAARSNSNGSTWYALGFQQGSSLQLWKKVNGTWSGSGPLASYSFSPSLDTWYTLKLVANGSTLVGYLNGVERVRATDTSITSGDHLGLRSRYSEVRFDNVRVTVP